MFSDIIVYADICKESPKIPHYRTFTMYYIGTMLFLGSYSIVLVVLYHAKISSKKNPKARKIPSGSTIIDGGNGGNDGNDEVIGGGDGGDGVGIEGGAWS